MVSESNGAKVPEYIKQATNSTNASQPTKGKTMKPCDNCHQKRPTVKYSFYPMRLCVDCLGELVMSALETMDAANENGSDHYIPQMAQYAYEEAMAAEEWD